MIGFLPISIVSAGMSLLRTGAGALSAFFGSSDKQFTSTYASTLTASRGMRGRPLNSYLKLSRIVERNPPKPRPRSTSFHSQEPFSNRPQHNRRPQRKVSAYHMLYILQNYEPFSSKNPVNKKSARKEDT